MNAVQGTNPDDRVTLASLFETQVARTPEAVALVHAETTLTYRELNGRANALAHQLIRRGVGPEDIVAVAVPRSPELLVALLAVLKAGGSYLPIDPSYPADRLAFMLADAAPMVVLADRATAATLPETVSPLLMPETPSGAPNPVDADRRAVLRADHPAYLIYTSGSTGRPKGVAVSHRAIVNRLTWGQSIYGIDATDAVLQKTSAAFDVSVWELFWPLQTGARLVLADPEGQGDPAYLCDLIAAQSVTVAHFVPSMLAAFLDQIEGERLSSLRHVFTSGEGLPIDTARRLRSRTAARLHNLYGPTETVVEVTFHEVGAELPGQGLVPIGLPVANSRVFVLDGRFRTVPVGVVGELYVAGVQLARGYRGRWGLTAARFVADPFDTGGRLYRTGDMVRWTSAGVLEFVGRSDDQVKIRGFRVEPGEIESVLRSHPSVTRAAVIARESAPEGGRQLIGYVTGRRDADAVDVEAVRRFAGARLPEYMVPAAIVVLDALPLSLNGKLDRRALPEPRFAPTADYRAPRTEREQLFADLFAEVLRLARVGVDDGFFALGGDSISAIQVVSRARRSGVLIRPQDVLTHQTPQALAASARDLVAADRSRDIGDIGVGPVTATPIVEWLAERGDIAEGFCQAMVISTPPALRAAESIRLVEALIDHHDMLRLRVVAEDPGSLEVGAVGSVSAATCLDRLDCSGTSREEIEKLVADAYASAGHLLGPPGDSVLRAVWFDAGPDRAGALLLAIHHLAVDGVSWRILLSDLAIGWEAIRGGDRIGLPVTGTSFRRWSTILAEEAMSPSREAELPVWKSIRAETESVVGALDPSRDTYGSAGHLTLTLPVAQTGPLLSSVPAAFHAGVQDILLASFAVAMTEWAARRGRGRVPVVVDVEGHGRDEALADGIDLSRTVGWFTSVYPVRLDAGRIDWTDVLIGDAALAERVKRVKEQLRAIPGSGLGFGLLRYLNRTTRAELAGDPNPEVGFNYLGRISSAHDDAPWRPSEGYGALLDSATPTMALAHALELNAVTRDDVDGPRLAATWTWAEALLTEDEVGELGRMWFAALGAMVACAERTGGGRTPSDLPLVSLTQQQIDRLETEYPGLEDVLPITPVQEGMLVHARYAGRAQDPYVVRIRLELEGSVDIARLRASFTAMIDRHPALRVRFVQSRLEQPVQVVAGHPGLPWSQLETASDEEWARALSADRARGFDLTAEPLVRALLMCLSPNRIRLSLTMHHIVCDGWSIPVLLRELFDIYLAGGKADRLPPVAPYRSFFEWYGGRDHVAAEAVWREALSGVAGPTLLAEAVGGAGADTGRVVVESEVPADLTSALHRMTRAHGTTLGIVLQVAWGILLARTTGREDVVFGSPVSGRPAELPGVETMVGLFINTVPVRLRPDPAMPVSELMDRARHDQIRLIDHQHIGLSEIHRWTRHSELFDTLFAVENYPQDPREVDYPAEDFSVTGVHVDDTTHYPFELNVLPGPALRLRAGFRTDVFDRETVDSLIQRWRRVLAAVVADPDVRVGDIETAR
ncbi:amino acid adenylation domain-containing protein [Nocardia sp. NPDC051570]|uniref:amino acid adenylation domain-containing protein n=1 Tax=Nocardia sp. NPDC051570 TaxID=3364324 RepID=UPI0037876A27